MPELVRGGGVIITIHYNEHPPPHVNTMYRAGKYRIDIQRCTKMLGDTRLPPAIRRQVLRWIARHRENLLAVW